MQEGLRSLLLIALGLAIAFFGYVVLTVPMIAVTGPAVILVALVVGFVFVWRSEPKRTAATREP